jgi:DNA-binding response OmpR family regulator
MTPEPHILVVDDARDIREPLGQYLKRHGFRASLAANAGEARAAVEDGAVDLVILDVMMPGEDGLSVCRWLVARGGPPVILLTAMSDDTDRIVGLELGADDYVVKPFSGAEVIARIRAILRRSAPAQAGERDLPPGPVEVGDLHVDVAARRARLGGTELQLSRKEFDLLAELIRNAGRVVTREQLMDRVWDENWFGSTKTLDVHVRWLRQKLGDDPAAPRYLHTVRGVGFRFTAPEELT